MMFHLFPKELLQPIALLKLHHSQIQITQESSEGIIEVALQKTYLQQSERQTILLTILELQISPFNHPERPLNHFRQCRMDMDCVQNIINRQIISHRKNYFMHKRR